MFWRVGVGKLSLSISLHISFLHSLSYAAWNSVGDVHLHFVPISFQYLSHSIKADPNLIFPIERLLGILLFPQHKVLILHIKYLPEFWMLCIAVPLLYIYCTSSCPRLMNWTYYAIFQPLWFDLYLLYF